MGWPEKRPGEVLGPHMDGLTVRVAEFEFSLVGSGGVEVFEQETGIPGIGQGGDSHWEEERGRGKTWLFQLELFSHGRGRNSTGESLPKRGNYIRSNRFQQ